MKTLRVLLVSVIFGLSSHFLSAQTSKGESAAQGIVNQAVIGENSHVSGDTVGKIRNATGTAASLVEPAKLLPRAPAKAKPGEAPEVSAALAFDDGTFTRLSAGEVSWASENQVVQVGPDGMLQIGQVSDSVRVRLSATAKGFAAEVLVRIDPLEEDETTHQPVPGKGPWPNAAAHGANWFQSQWFGSFNATKHRWIYHDGLGWLYPSGDTPDNLWLWDRKQNWLWTNRQIYPQLFRHRDQTWLYYMVKVKSQRIFFNYATNQLEFE
ncbi:MAG: hypothetical protein CMI31_09060 [Opitutae bacterium]|nr:hypothetical protein [Opitutae bacterium]|tara:strand:- start:74 stop:874 length:801 start_codon:yes stop_codon:yes gene_type:complete